MAADKLPRNIKEMIDQLRASTQASLGARQSRLAVEMPVGMEFGVEGQKAKRKGKTKIIGSEDIIRSNRELARLFVGMFEGTGLVPLVLFPSDYEATAAKKMWDAPGLEASVKALVPLISDEAVKVKTTPAAAKAGNGGGFGGGGGGFGGGASKKGKKAKPPPPPLTRVPPKAEVVFAVSPGEAQLGALQEFCEASGMDQLVILLNARLYADAEAPPEACAYFEDGGDGGFETAFTFLTQPLGMSTAKPDGDPIVLWRAYPDEWVFARKPAIGPPRSLLTREGEDGRPRLDELRDAVESEKTGGLFGGMIG